ncbi:MAG: four helix bundle protein [Ignavibacteriota bacterium]
MKISDYKNDPKEIKIRCYKYSVEVVKFISNVDVPRKFNPIVDQFLRSATSIGANVVEGKAAHSKRDFIKFYEIALKSANETKYWICLLRDGLDLKNMDRLLKEADEISKVLVTIIINTKKSK